MRWMNKPDKWKQKGDDIKVTVPEETDFWRGTLHGFTKDDAPFYWMFADNDFETRLTIKGKFKYLYDQAGLMLRIDAENWVKLGICHYRDQLYVSCCFTRGKSDWSTHRLPITKIDKFHVWAKRKGEVIDCYYSLDNENWIHIRQGYFSDKPRIRVGMMCAAPESAGFKVTFSDFMIKNTVDDDDKEEDDDDNDSDDDDDDDDGFQDRHALDNPAMSLLPPNEGGTLGTTNWDENEEEGED